MGRVEIGGGCICPLSWGTITLYVIVDMVKGEGRTPPTLKMQAGPLFPTSWNVRQKVVFSTLCVLCGETSHIPNL